jgi:hypothetical protein
MIASYAPYIHRLEVLPHGSDFLLFLQVILKAIREQSDMEVELLAIDDEAFSPFLVAKMTSNHDRCSL